MHLILNLEFLLGLTQKTIALFLKKTAEDSIGRKTDPLKPAMPILNFNINRAGMNFPSERKIVLNKARGGLRKLKGREVENEV